MLKKKNWIKYVGSADPIPVQSVSNLINQTGLEPWSADGRIGRNGWFSPIFKTMVVIDDVTIAYMSPIK